jgi:glycine/D-amino acid oxidase-like deaminating enzyme
MAAPEFVIVGQGLAGTALAWSLMRRGRNVLVADDDRGSASRLAAGLITPVTGKRLAKSWRWEELYPAAVAFYRTCERETGAEFFHQKPAVRVFADGLERDEYFRREKLLHGLVRPVELLSEAWFHTPFGAFEMPVAARLDVQRYLDESRRYFLARTAFAGVEVDPRGLSQSVTVIFCRGFVAGADPWFGSIRFNAAKGEILTVRVPGLREDRVVHRGVWLAPRGEEIFRVGATYTWDPLDTRPTAVGRSELEEKLRTLVKLPYEVLDHVAGVRPVIDAGYPVLGCHPENPRVAYFNGLGSKGALLAPLFAEQLAAHLCGAGSIEESLHVRRVLR